MASWHEKLALVAQKNRQEVYAGAADHRARLRRAGRYERVDLGQGNRQVSAKLHGKNITLDQVVKTAGEAVWSSPL